MNLMAGAASTWSLTGLRRAHQKHSKARSLDRRIDEREKELRQYESRWLHMTAGRGRGRLHWFEPPSLRRVQHSTVAARLLDKEEV